MVYLDGKPLQAAAGLTLAEVLRREGRDPALTAVTADGKFVPQAEYRSFRVQDGARLKFYRLLSGG